MLGRFIRFYPGYTAETALKLPWRRFTVLLGAIPTLEAQEQLQAVLATAYGTNPGEKGKALRDYLRTLEKTAHVEPQPHDTLVPGIMPLVVAAPAGEIEQLRERQRAAEAQRQRERAEWQAQHGQ